MRKAQGWGVGGQVSDGNISSLKSGTLDAAVTSPPYAEGLGHGGEKKNSVGRDDKAYRDRMYGRYGKTDGQIEQLPAGTLDAAITSPPYAESIGNKHGIDYSQAKDERAGLKPSTARDAVGGSCGTTEGNIGNLKEGTVDGCVTSPPFLDNSAAQAKSYAGFDHVGSVRRKANDTKAGYGESDGQIGNTSSQTYWEAVRQVYEQVYLALKPGAVFCAVLKDYVKNKKRVPLCDDTCTLLTSVGFHVFERTRAWVVQETREPSLFGGEVVKTKSRKSFFRRLAESKGSPAIDWEEVIWCRKPDYQPPEDVA